MIRWDVVTLGNISRNRYWGEADDRPRRAPLCTSTLITVENFHLLVDPSLADAAQMAGELDRRADIVVLGHDNYFLTRTPPSGALHSRP